MINVTDEFLKSITTEPGCYLYKDENGKVLYVGKAKNLRARVSSYFKNAKDLEVKIRIMLRKAVNVDFLTVDSEVEALILETNLIKKYRPRYNRLMKDDKSYVWVMFDNAKDFPRPEIVWEKRKKSAIYFGPFPKRFPASQVLKRLRKTFPYCNTNFKIEERIVNGKRTVRGAEKRPCLDYHIGLCSGICAGLASKTEHRSNINNIKKFFRGQKQEIYSDLQSKMQSLAKHKKYEAAAKIRNQISDLEYVTQRIQVDDEVSDENIARLKKSTNYQAVEDLMRRLRFWDANKKISERTLKNFRIECYDISNIQGTNATGSMVVMIGGRKAVSDYRKFKIKTKSTPDDFAMMQEVLTRRFKRLNVANEKDASFKSKPDLIIVDGGKGQLSSAWEILKGYSLLDQIHLAGLAKREEELFRIYIENNEKVFRKTVLPRRSNSLYLVQRIRDEAHRFAIGYHRTLRSKSSHFSMLDEVPGVGDVVRKRLLNAFGSLEGIKKAKRKDLETVVRNKRTVEAIIKLLK